LLNRARRLVSKDFLEILQDLAPAGVAQAQTIRGPEETKS
jgi:type VI secretion system protein ImpA